MSEHRELLRRLRQEAATRADEAAAALAELTREREGSNDDDEHDPEGVTLSSEWAFLSAGAQAAAERLAQIDEALEREQAGTYGICADCGTPIPAARLEIRPFAQRCVPCAEKRGE